MSIRDQRALVQENVVAAPLANLHLHSKDLAPLRSDARSEELANA